MDALEIMFGKRSIADKIAESKEGYKDEITEDVREKHIVGSSVKRSDKTAIASDKSGIENTTVKKTTVKKTTIKNADVDKGKDLVMASGVSTMQIKSVEKVKDKLSKRYIAFDTETIQLFQLKIKYCI